MKEPEATSEDVLSERQWRGLLGQCVPMLLLQLGRSSSLTLLTAWNALSRKSRFFYKQLRLYFFLFETGILCVALAVLELAL